MYAPFGFDIVDVCTQMLSRTKSDFSRSDGSYRGEQKLLMTFTGDPQP